MSDPLKQVEELLLAQYAQKGIYPRPNDVTQKDIDTIRRLSSVFARDLMAVLGLQRREDEGLAGTVRKLDRQVDIYEDPELLELARKEIPMEQLQATAAETQKGNEPLPGYEDALAEALVKCFKPNYFVWRDPVKCTSCQGPTQSIGMAEPTQDDLIGGAGRVEQHKCLNSGCNTIVRFPRYNNLRYLMRSKVGRCGEFANLFALFVRAVGLRGRYVWNAEDHVWNEYWSPGLNRWVHMDSCENARDQHLLYDVGWGKKQSYILAFSVEGAQDVSRGYIKDFDAALSRRNQISEEALQKLLEDVTRNRRAGLSATRLQELEREDAGEKRFLDGYKEDDLDLPARQTGTEEWIKARGEDGSSTK